MENNFKSRYGQTRTVTEQEDGSYIIEGQTNFYRMSVEENGTTIMFDFEGGPFIMVGEKGIEFDVNRTVTSIEVLHSGADSAKVKVFCK